jgi:hypothetical protein
MTGRRIPRPLWPPFEFSPRYTAQVLQRVWYCLLGLGIGAIGLFIVYETSIGLRR